MKRRLFTLAAGVSLVLCLATVGLWVRSYWRSDAMVYVGPAGHWGIQWTTGRLCAFSDNMGKPQRRLQLDSWPALASPPEIGSGRWTRLGFGYEMQDHVPNVPAKVGEWLADSPQFRVRTRRLLMPMWFVALVFSILPALKLLAIASNRQREEGRCPTCGYDLRATPQRCPECGKVPAAQ